MKIIVWLLLTSLSSIGLGQFFLQKKYEEKSAEFRILYREITVYLSQHDTFITLLSTNQKPHEVQKILPQILGWKRFDELKPLRPIIPEKQGRYWINHSKLSLLIDISKLLFMLNEKNNFEYVSISFNDTIISQQGANFSAYWRWEKTIASQTQPFLVTASTTPEWAKLPWLLILSPAPFWALTINFLTQYGANKRRKDIAHLRTHYAELTQLNTLGELAASMVHELNQPLTAIMSYNQAAIGLLKQKNHAKVPDLMDASVLQIKRIDAILHQFRQKLNSESIEYKHVDLQKLWLRVCKLLDNELCNANIQVISHFSDDIPSLFAPPLWLEQILHNITSNAIQAQTRGRGWIQLDAKVENHGISLTLVDGGPGFSPEALEHVFIPFFTTRAQGVGLGMALTETLVQRLNGTIKASNTTTHGACFSIWFPFMDEEN